MWLLINNIHEKIARYLWNHFDRESTRARKLRAKTICSNAAYIITPCSQNNILLDVFIVCKLQKRAELFMELFNVFELKILGYYLESSVKKGATVFLFCLRWFQECQWFNCLLYYIRHSLQVLEHCVLGGSPAIPPSLASVVDSLQCNIVPTDWLHPDSQPSPHILTSWLKGNDRWCSKSE